MITIRNPAKQVAIAALSVGTFTILMSGTAVTGAVIGAPNTNAMWIGFLLFVGGFLALAIAGHEQQEQS